MRVRVDGEAFVGPALDLRGRDVDPASVLAAIRAGRETIDPVHEQVGCVYDGMSFSLQRALAAAARSRGETTPHDEQLRAVETALAEHERSAARSPVDLRAAREEAAAAGADVDALREQVARVSGRVEARRAAGIDVEGARQRLRAVTRRLSEAETERIAAEQRLASARRQAREDRDRRERRLKLTDRCRNLRRRAERALSERERRRFERAVAGLPVETAPEPSGEFSGSPAVAALAVLRIARVRTPVVVASGPFRHAAQARACLDAPVVLL